MRAEVIRRILPRGCLLSLALRVSLPRFVERMADVDHREPDRGGDITCDPAPGRRPPA